MEFRFTLLHDWLLVLWACFAYAVTLYYFIQNYMKDLPKKLMGFFVCFYGESSAQCLEIIYNDHKQ